MWGVCVSADLDVSRYHDTHTATIFAVGPTSNDLFGCVDVRPDLAGSMKSRTPTTSFSSCSLSCNSSSRSCVLLLLILLRWALARAGNRTCPLVQQAGSLEGPERKCVASRGGRSSKAERRYAHRGQAVIPIPSNGAASHAVNIQLTGALFCRASAKPNSARTRAAYGTSTVTPVGGHWPA